ncbi:META domain-containing protein [Sphingomonas sp. AR_OL41]|uniref:META domain-containing protein n=1 Tax=Sphingomonas sp. AR_OL41 TaxID=3042729 RepID=UPI00247FB044|nr:META domain-containing protein [Sphingomonas sp. AR_OL41]MDH7970879.1 META domain-containing protein [Sphingomonas sp. AR_OL41]
MKPIVTLAAPALLIATAATAQPASAPYRASGSEPSWTLRIDRGLIAFAAPRDRLRVVAPAPVARPSFNGLRYVTPRITVDVTYARCIDLRTREAYHDRVTVMVGRRSFSGCGGEKLTPTLALAGTRWMIAAIDGQPVRSTRTTDIRFTGTRIAGNAGCNSFGGSYSQERNTLVTRGLISTKMACPGAGMATESAFFRVIGSPTTIGESVDKAVILSGQGGSVTLRRAD